MKKGGISKTSDAKFNFLTDADNAAAHAPGIMHANELPMGMQMPGYDSGTGNITSKNSKNI